MSEIIKLILENQLAIMVNLQEDRDGKTHVEDAEFMRQQIYATRRLLKRELANEPA